MTHRGGIERAWLDKDRFQLRLCIGLRHGGHDGPVELVANGGRRFRRRHQRIERRRGEAFDAALADCRNAGKQRNALRRRDGDNLDVATAVERHHGAHIAEHDVDMPAGEIGDRRLGATIGNVHELGARPALEQFHREMRRRAVTLRRIAQLVRIGFGVSDQVTDGLDRKPVSHREDIGPHGHDCNRLETRRVVAQMLEQRRIRGDHVRRRGEKGVAIGLGMRDGIRRDIAGAAGPVFDDERFAPERLEMVRNNTSRQIDTAARRHGHDDLDVAARVVVFSGPSRHLARQQSSDAEEGCPSIDRAHDEVLRVGDAMSQLLILSAIVHTTNAALARRSQVVPHVEFALVLVRSAKPEPFVPCGISSDSGLNIEFGV